MTGDLAGSIARVDPTSTPSTAEEREGKLAPVVVPQLLETNGGPRLLLRPQERNHLPEGPHAPPPAVARPHDGAADDVGEALRVQPSVIQAWECGW